MWGMGPLPTQGLRFSFQPVLMVPPCILPQSSHFELELGMGIRGGGVLFLPAPGTSQGLSRSLPVVLTSPTVLLGRVGGRTQAEAAALV